MREVSLEVEVAAWFLKPFSGFGYEPLFVNSKQVVSSFFVMIFAIAGAMPLNRNRPMVSGPKDVYSRIAGTGRPSAETGEQIDCCGHGASYVGAGLGWAVCRN